MKLFNEDEVFNYVKDFLEGGSISIEFDLMANNKLHKILDKLNCTYFDGMSDSNGWQNDWWEYYEYKGQKLLASGSGYYGESTLEKLENFD